MSLRSREKGEEGQVDLKDVIARIQQEIKTRVSNVNTNISAE